MVQVHTPNARTHSLTRDEILNGALELIDTEGLGALTMRRLAREVGVEAMTLYHHFPNKDAILDGVAQTIIARMRLDDPLPEDWMDLLVMFAVAFRRTLAEHPNAMPILMTRPMAPPADATVTPASVLAGAGFDPERMLEMYRSLMALTFGHAAIASAEQVGSEPAADAGVRLETDDEAFRRAARILIAGYAAEEQTRETQALSREAAPGTR